MKKTLFVIVSLLLLSGACWSDDLEANAEEAKYYDNAKVVRIKSVEGEGFVRRSYDEGDEEAVANLPLFEKDTVGTTDGRLAVYMGRMNYLRLDGDTLMVLEKIPQLSKTDLAVRLESGSIYLEVVNLDREKGIEIQTPDCGIFLLDKGMYRVNVMENRTTQVIVHEGIAEVSGTDSSRNVRENQKIVMARGEMEERPYYFYASEKDDFDRWNEGQDRELGYARSGTSRYLQNGYEDYEYEMSRSGRWTYMSDYNSYVWSPYYAGSDWIPYSNGRWVWNPYYGYVWTSYDTCGWFTHHYGRWQWDYSFGWYWIPSYHWSPAWVSWFWNDNYYGWSPMSWWNRPVIVINNRWDRNYDYHRGIPRHSRSTIIIRKNELAAPNIHRVALSKSSLGQDQDGSNIAFRGKAPSERLADSQVKVINARGRSVTYKQGGIVSSEKYRTQGSDIKSGTYRYDSATGSDVATRKNSSATGTTGYRSRTGSESGSPRVRNSASSGDSSGKTNYRSKSDSSSSTSSSSSSSKSDSSSSTSSSSSSSNSNSTARKKKKEAPSYLSRSGGGNSGNTGSEVTRDARYQSRTSSAGSGGSTSRSYGSTNASRDYPESAAAATSSRRHVGSAPASGSGSSYSRPSSSYGSTRSRSYEPGSSGSYKPSSSTSRPSSSSASGRSYSPSSGSRSSSSAGSSRSSSSSSSNGSSSRAAKKK